MDGCRGLVLRAPLAASLVIVLGLLAASVAALRISYETNDDVFMTMIAAGTGFCPAPDEHLLFTNVLVGQALKQLYRAWPDVPWYGGYLLLVHYLAQVALLYCALTMPALGRADADETTGRPLRWRLALFLVCFVLVELVLLNQLQFTSTAFLAAQAGCFLLLRAACRCGEESRPKSFALFSAAVTLIVVAGLVRLESLYLALAMMAPPAALVAAKCSQRALLPAAVAASIATLLVASADQYNRATYAASDAWRDFYEFNALRCKFNDYGWTTYTPQTERVFAAVGWTKLDHEMIAHWFFDDPVKYSQTKLRQVVEGYPWKTSRWTIGYLPQAFRRPLQDRAVWAVWLALPGAVWLAARRPLAGRTVAATLVVALCLLAAISLNNKMPPLRIYFPLLAFPLSALLLFAGTAGEAVQPAGMRASGRAGWQTFGSQPAWSRVVAVLLLVGATMGVYRQARRTIRVEEGREELASFVETARADQRKLYVAWEAALPYELLSPLDNLEKWRGVQLLNLTWTQRTPWQDAVKRRLVMGDLADALCRRDDIVLVATPAHRELFEAYARERFQVELEFAESRRFGERAAAGRYFQGAADETARRPARAAPR